MPRFVAIGLLTGVLLAACTGSDDSSSGSSGSSNTVSGNGSVTTHDYLPLVAADVYRPSGVIRETVPTVVFVPGGAWVTADREGLAPLARELQSAGMVVVNATHRGLGRGANFPEPVQDVSCSVAFAADQAERFGFVPLPIVIVGHSTGAHLAALVALGDATFRGACPYDPVVVDALVGLAGIYDPMSVPELARPLFRSDPSDDAARWELGNALSWASARSDLPVLLIHGDDDELVPVEFTEEFAMALRRAGHRVQMGVVPRAGHHDVYHPDVVGSTIMRWIATL
jgi:acetyl esterase/lipase